MPSIADVRLARSEADIRRCFPVMQVLRTHLARADDFVVTVRRMQGGFGWRLAFIEDPRGTIAAVTGFRVSEFLWSGKTLYVDDLVALESHRGQGYAEALMEWMMALARAEGCETFSLDSGTQRLGAHRFYHRMKMVISSFHFQRSLSSPAKR